MANELQTISWLVGGAVVIGLGYYAYTKGIFDQAFDFINDAIKNGGSSSSTTPAEEKEEEEPAETPPPASKCKSGELENSKGKCVKCATELDAKDKCVKKSKFAVSYVAGSTGPYASHRVYVVS